MLADHEATVRAFFGAWVERDPDRLTRFFAPDGTWTEANRDPAKGPDEIRPVFELQTSFASDFSFEFKRLEVVGDTVFTERVDRFVINDTPMAVPVAGIFEFDADGRISAWRDYYDWALLEAQLLAAGVDLTGVEGI
ncbi:MAG TPA: limonene-1,2-epoxide hydrolase family protein [Acidimicrobiales bacterium]|nr:limonene-1,2-epoxide hydrolase family protein [Acidimicrobiales bacterium]